MNSAAAKGKAALLALAVLAAAGAAEASRTSPGAANELLKQPASATLIAAPQPEGLVAAFAFEPASRFPLFAGERPGASAFRLFPDLAPAPGPAASLKLASGPQTWEPQLNVWQIRYLASISHQCAVAYHRARWLDTTNASWLSPDPLGSVDSQNLYDSLGSNPVGAVDPTGTYQGDFHYGLTLFLAIEVGYSRGEAAAVANEDYQTDVSPTTSSTINAASGNWAPVYEYHFPIDPMSHRVVEGGPAAWAKVNGATDLVSLGRGLHVLQDSYAHHNAYAGNMTSQAGAVGAKGWIALGAVVLGGTVGADTGVRNPGTGITHELPPGRMERLGKGLDPAAWKRAIESVDWTWTDPGLAMRAAAATYYALVRFKELHDGYSAEKANELAGHWQQLEYTVLQFARARTVLEKREWFEKNLPWAVDLVPWEDLTLLPGK